MNETLREQLEAKRGLPSPPLRRAIRQAAGATIEEVATEVGVSKYAVLQWEQGNRNPSRRHLSKYVRLLREMGSPGTDPQRDTDAAAGLVIQGSPELLVMFQAAVDQVTAWLHPDPGRSIDPRDVPAPFSLLAYRLARLLAEGTTAPDAFTWTDRQLLGFTYETRVQVTASSIAIEVRIPDQEDGGVTP